MKTTSERSDYNGYTNRATWNVALWLDNDEPNYRATCEFAAKHQGKVTPTMTHTLTLKSTGRVDVKRREAKYNASCSCGTWHAGNMIASEARESYDRHAQAVAGPDAQDAPRGIWTAVGEGLCRCGNQTVLRRRLAEDGSGAVGPATCDECLIGVARDGAA